ncbi:flagellar protein FliL [Clostridium putrefaciens]|uniref:Flagellar protein FliL n=1 Tax=Clostridium putrefaciens TaxID=99675 RepID=A0A381J875_9CLOT|nr:flagellar basal body-associated FliL family protein [Clostridium putrefaciens]SUY47474.1 flagellar protein FliL [Clostridium putrefaciens]
MRENDKNEKQGGKTLKIIIIILLVLVLLGGGIFAGIFLFSKDNTKGSTAQATEIKVEEKTYSLDDFLVNLSDEGGKHYLKINISLGYDVENKKLEKELDSKKDVMRDSVISILRNKKSTDVTIKGTEDLKKEILDIINPLLNNGKLTNIYFKELIFQ